MVVKYFSWIKEHIGKSEEQIDLPSNITNVNQLINYLNEIDEKYNIIFEKKDIGNKSTTFARRYDSLKKKKEKSLPYARNDNATRVAEKCTCSERNSSRSYSHGRR